MRIPRQWIILYFTLPYHAPVDPILDAADSAVVGVISPNQIGHIVIGQTAQENIAVGVNIKRNIYTFGSVHVSVGKTLTHNVVAVAVQIGQRQKVLFHHITIEVKGNQSHTTGKGHGGMRRGIVARGC
ncbi:MAG: hypothetical protein IKX32_07075 [Bacteroidales bacterium]|nr:hypothetical protein [Bacteroidales bacterium]